LRNLCDGLVEDAGFEAAQAGCRIGGEREDVTTLAYPQLLRRAIDNVLRNAIRYAPAGTEIVLNCRADPEGQVVLEILDSGPGVPDSMLSDIFRPFFRTAPGRDASSGGTGLGLAIAAETTRMHEGSITAHNRKNGGLQVTIIFPVKEPASSPHAPPSEESTAWQALPE
jgi:two-component system sensor histidine kinase CpxA